MARRWSTNVLLDCRAKKNLLLAGCQRFQIYKTCRVRPSRHKLHSFNLWRGIIEEIMIMPYIEGAGLIR